MSLYTRNPVGASLLAIAVGQAAMMLTDTPSSRASSLPQGSPWTSGIASIVELAAFGFDGFGERPGFGFFVAQLGLGFRLFEGGNRGQ